MNNDLTTNIFTVILGIRNFSEVIRNGKLLGCLQVFVFMFEKRY